MAPEEGNINTSRWLEVKKGEPQRPGAPPTPASRLSCPFTNQPLLLNREGDVSCLEKCTSVEVLDERQEEELAGGSSDVYPEEDPGKKLLSLPNSVHHFINPE